MGRNVNHIVSKEEWDNRVRWEDLSDEEQEAICDGGCGVNIFGFKIIPDFIFKPHCCRHDFGSVRGGDEYVRILVDSGFARGVMFSAVHHPSSARKYISIARIYLNTVFAVHPRFFDYGPMKDINQIREWIEGEKKKKEQGFFRRLFS